MNKYKGKNIVSIISSAISGLVGIGILTLSKGTITNIIGIAFMILAIVGFANYYKYSIVIDSGELRITRLLKPKKVRYKDIVKVFTVQAGNTTITYIVDKYMENGKWYIRGTYPPASIDKLKDVKFNSISDLVSINSYVFKNYGEILDKLVKKVKGSSEIDIETWKAINPK